MKKILCLCVILSLILSFNCIMVSAEESRVPSNIEFTQYEGTSIEPEYEYKNVNTRGVRDVQVIKGSYPGWPEFDAGAHYYAYSPITADYAEAYTRVNLPTSLNRNNTNSGRNAYISLGVFGTLGNYGVDLGIRNDGTGWHPYHYDVKSGNFVVYDEVTVGSTAKKAVIVATPITTTSIRLYVQFQNASGAEIDYFYQTINVASNNFSIGYNGYIACHYYRFASLVNYPDEPDNQEDGTYMLGGNFNGLALYNRNTSTYENWGMSSSLVNQAWEVSPENVTVSYTTGSDTESFNIDHRP